MAKKNRKKTDGTDLENKLSQDASNQNEEDGNKENKNMVVEWVTIVISIFALAVATISLWYSSADYKYKRDPVIGEVTGNIEFHDGDEYNEVSLAGLNVEIGLENNLEDVYMINPAYEVRQIISDDFTEAIGQYFKESYEANPVDFEKNGWKYFCRFMIFTTMDDDIEINLFYYKTQVLPEKANENKFELNKVDHINLIQLEKAKPDDPEYEGEKIMAKQFKELYEYYSGLM